ncbi:MAG: DNA-3-methyladenine glycosylase I [bacterium]
MVARCPWPLDDLVMIAYHDTEWGVPVHDDRKHFEYLLLDGFQAGLSWAVVLHKREAFRAAFAGFNPERVAAFTTARVGELLCDPGIVRNRQKIKAAVRNAQAFLRVREEYGSFDEYIWQFTGGVTKVNRWRTLRSLPTTSTESDEMSMGLRSRGFTFCGSTICYAYMQAAGMVNDHLVRCFRHREVQGDKGLSNRGG